VSAAESALDGVQPGVGVAGASLASAWPRPLTVAHRPEEAQEAAARASAASIGVRLPRELSRSLLLCSESLGVPINNGEETILHPNLLRRAVQRIVKTPDTALGASTDKIHTLSHLGKQPPNECLIEPIFALTLQNDDLRVRSVRGKISDEINYRPLNIAKVAWWATIARRGLLQRRPSPRSRGQPPASRAPRSPRRFQRVRGTRLHACPCAQGLPPPGSVASASDTAPRITFSEGPARGPRRF
jgi:hypothetical protein